MPIITTTLPAFKKLAKGLVFEGQERLVTMQSGILIQAFKVNSARIFPDALPLRAIGYPGINTVEVKLDVNDAEALINHILSMLSSDEKEILRQRLKEEMKR